ncbi:MAG: CsoS2 family carboxysome shell protein [Gammaproteobacteria bacterium]
MSRRERLTQGKSALRNTGVAAGASQGLTGRDAAIARRQQLIAGRGAAAPTPTPPTAQAAAAECGCRHAEPATAPEVAPTPSTRSRSRVRAKAVKQDHGRLMSMARRAAMANRGKAGVEALNGRSGSSATATVMRSSGASSREIARKVREERCERGKVGESKPVAARPLKICTEVNSA